MSQNFQCCNLLQSPEKETKGILLDAEGVQSKKGARIFTSAEAYQEALHEAGLLDDIIHQSQSTHEEEQPRAAVAGIWGTKHFTYFTGYVTCHTGHIRFFWMTILQEIQLEREVPWLGCSMNGILSSMHLVSESGIFWVRHHLLQQLYCEMIFVRWIFM